MVRESGIHPESTGYMVGEYTPSGMPVHDRALHILEAGEPGGNPDRQNKTVSNMSSGPNPGAMKQQLYLLHHYATVS